MIRIRHKDLERMAEAHYSAIKNYMNKSKREYNVSQFDEWVSRYFPGETFQSIVIASPERLRGLIDTWEEGRATEKRTKDFQPFKTYYTYLNSNKEHFFTDEHPIYNAKTLIENLGITVCPYCNRNYIYNVASHKMRPSELDHFFPKEKYPFLALSFYNLIPCCKVCNQAKAEEILPINPYDTNSTFDKVRFRIKITSADFYHKAECFALSLSGENLADVELVDINTHKRVLNLEEQYRGHKDIVLELLQKSHTYNDSYIDELYRQYEGTLFKNREDVLRHVYGNYVDPADDHKRPLAKLVRDVTEALEE